MEHFVTCFHFQVRLAFTDVTLLSFVLSFVLSPSANFSCTSGIVLLFTETSEIDVAIFNK